ncbi:hypothetical protein Scep_016589 [Stephania cephalantha]|uniref:Uncharacterized protein n=1 Tax=Stephania cephalantha TaxID=152367 RepID=A0AAP0NW32_9MAGN
MFSYADQFSYCCWLYSVKVYRNMLWPKKLSISSFTLCILASHLLILFPLDYHAGGRLILLGKASDGRVQIDFEGLANLAKLQMRRQELTQTTPDQPVDDEAVYYKVAGECPKGCVYSLRSLWRKKRRYVDPDASISQVLAQRGMGNFMILRHILWDTHPPPCTTPHHHPPPVRCSPILMSSDQAQEISLRSFKYEELEQATNGFKEEVGRGAFGTLPNNNQTIARRD